jgi:RNA polymerase sigma-70 factor (ECF subfamily)
VDSTTSFLRKNPDAHTEFLVGKARAGSETAWRELFSRYRKMLVAQVQARIPGFARRRFDAEDVLQAAFVRAWRNIESFEYRGEGSFRRWLATLVVNTFQTELRSQGRAEHQESETELSRVADQAALREGELDRERVAMLEAMGELGEEDRDILIQRVFEELSFDAIAEIMGCGREAARQLYTQAVQRLQRRLGA